MYSCKSTPLHSSHLHAEDVEARFNHLLSERKRRCKVVTPLPPGIKLTKESKVAETNSQREYAEAFPYQSVYGFPYGLGSAYKT